MGRRPSRQRARRSARSCEQVGEGLGAVVSSDSLHRPNSPTVSETLPCDTPSPRDACPGSERTLCTALVEPLGSRFRSQTRTRDPSRFYHTVGLETPRGPKHTFSLVFDVSNLAAAHV